MTKILTIFTPTYNRSHTLPLGYEALKRQTSKDFKWLIIDDGSSDNTKELVDKWIKEGVVEIDYVYKENGGMHTAHNKAYELIDTELNVCIDSDDYMADDAVESIVDFWKANGSDTYAGMIALDADFKGQVLGTLFNTTIKSTTLSGFYKKGGKGDKKLIYRTEIINKYPAYPVFSGEKYFGLNYKYLLADRDFELLTLNKVVCLVEYQATGSSNNMLKQYWNNPNGFAQLRIFYMHQDKSLKSIVKNTIHYISSNLIAKNQNYIHSSPYPFVALLLYPLGFLFYQYIKYNNINR